MPSLDGAYARIRRANKHIEDLKRECLSSIEPYTNWQPLGNEVIELGAMSWDIGILFGETAYNLRAALDYLVYELCALDSDDHVAKEKTQFPIEDSPNGWESALRRKYLGGLNIAHQACIESLQPYMPSGCKWLKDIRDFSNPDKHRQIRPTLIRLEHQTNLLEPEHLAMQMNRALSVEILLDDGRSLVESVEKLPDQVIALLELFKPEF